MEATSPSISLVFTGRAPFGVGVRVEIEEALDDQVVRGQDPVVHPVAILIEVMHVRHGTSVDPRKIA
jgi:hypothetical protein